MLSEISSVVNIYLAFFTFIIQNFPTWFSAQLSRFKFPLSTLCSRIKGIFIVSYSPACKEDLLYPSDTLIRLQEPRASYSTETTSQVTEYYRAPYNVCHVVCGLQHASPVRPYPWNSDHIGRGGKARIEFFDLNKGRKVKTCCKNNFSHTSHV